MADGILKINQILEAYTQEVTEGIKEIAEAIGEDAVKELKSTSPKRNRKYSGSWRKKVDKGSNFINIKIHNSKYYRLTHLLEFGHATRSGGRTKAQPHIQPIEEKANQRFIMEVETLIRKGKK